jgi:hypothetical protein
VAELTEAELAQGVSFWPATAKGWTWTWQRCGRYEYRECLTHSIILTTWFPACGLRRMCRLCGQPAGRWLGASMADDAQRRDLAKKAGCGSATIPPGDLTSPNRQTPPQGGDRD